MSKRITKAMAEDAAIELTKIAFDKKVEKAEKDRLALAKHLVEKYIPAPVLQCAKEYLGCYDHQRRVEFTTEGLGHYGYKWLYLDYEHPKFNQICLSKSDFDSYDKADKLYDDLKNARDNYKDEVTNAIFNLRTERNVAELFPEALPFLNFTECTALAPNLTPLRALLNQNL